MGLDIHDSTWLREMRDIMVGQPTLRDQFAMAALPAIITTDGEYSGCSAKYAYQIADAMLAARGESNEKV